MSNIGKSGIPDFKSGSINYSRKIPNQKLGFGGIIVVGLGGPSMKKLAIVRISESEYQEHGTTITYLDVDAFNGSEFNDQDRLPASKLRAYFPDEIEEFDAKNDQGYLDRRNEIFDEVVKELKVDGYTHVVVLENGDYSPVEAI